MGDPERPTQEVTSEPSDNVLDDSEAAHGHGGKDAVIAWCHLPRGCFVVADPGRISLKDSMSVGALQRHRRIHTGAPRRVQAQLQATAVKQVSQ